MTPIACVMGLLLTAPPALLAGAQTAPQVVLSPTHYDLTLEVDYEAERLRGTARIDVENRSETPVGRASLLLYRLLSVREVTDGSGRGLRFAQSVVAFEDFPKLQVNQLLVTLPEPLAPGASTVIRIDYEGHLLGYAETGMRYIRDRIDPEFTILRDDSYAYPQPGYPSNAVNRAAPRPEFTYAATITVPPGFTVANGGMLEGVDSAGAVVAYRYASLKPSWRMDFAIAEYGSLSSGSIRVFHLPGSEDGAAGVVRAAETALARFSDWFGPVAGAAALTFIEIPDGWGSQADVTTIIQSSAAFKDPRRHREVYHEISHLWNVAPSDRPSPRWDEGLASFLEYLVTEDVTGEAVVDARATQLVQWLRQTLPGRAQWREVPPVDYGKHGLTDLSYSVGALFFDLLYRLEGRESFNGLIAEFAARGGSTDEFLSLVRRRAGPAASRVVDDWMSTTAWAERVQQAEDIHELEAFYRRGPSDRTR